MRATTIKEHLKCSFTEQEIKEKAIQLAQECRAKEEVEAEKKQVMQDFNAKLAAHGAKISLLSNQINNGYEYRYVDCDIIYDSPTVGKKHIVRNDIFDTVRIEDMTADEMQGELFDSSGKDQEHQFSTGEKVRIKAFVSSGKQEFAEFTEAEFVAYSGDSDVVVSVGEMNHVLKISDIEPIVKNGNDGVQQEVLEASESQDTQPWDSAQRIEK